MDSAVLVGQSHIVGVGRDHNILGILQEVVSTQVADIVCFHTADGTGSVSVCLGLVFFIQTIVEFISVGIIVSQVEQRSNGPVAKECQVRNAHVHLGAGLGLQGNEAFHIHAVLKGVGQICLICIGQSNLHSDHSGLACANGHLLATLRAALYGQDLHLGLQGISFLGDSGLTGSGLGLADTLGEHIRAQGIADLLIAEVLDLELHLVDTLLLGIVAQLQLGLVYLVAFFIVSGNKCGGLHSVAQVSQTSALLSDSIGQAVGTQRNVCGGHEQLVDHFVDLHLVLSDLGEGLLHILTHEDHHTCQVRAGHGSTGQTVIAATGDGGQNVTTVAGQLGLNVQAGSGTPGRELRNEGTCGLFLAQLQLATAGSGQHFAIILRNGTYRDLSVTHVHLDLTGYIIINNNTGSALLLGNLCFFFEGVVATANQSDLAFHIQTGIVHATAHAWNHNELIGLGLVITQQRFVEILLFAGCIGGLIEIDDGVAVLQIGSLLTGNGCDGQNALVSTGRTNRTGIGIGGQTQVTVGLRAVSRRVAVGCGNHNRDTVLTDSVIDTGQHFFVGLTGKACGSTQGHVNHVNTQNHTVFQCGQDPGSSCGVHNIGEGLHGDQLSIGSNTGDHIVLTDNNTGNVGTMVIVGGVDVGIVIGIVIAVRHLLIDVYIINTQAAGLLISLGLIQNRSHLFVGQTQLGRGEVAGAESGMAGVQTGIQHSHDHAGAVIAAVGAVENTGVLIEVNRIFNHLGIGSLIFFANDDALAIGQALASDIEITSLDHQLEAGQQSCIVQTQGVVHTGLVQLLQDLRLLTCDLGLNVSSLLIVQHILSKTLGGITLLVGGEHIRNIHGDDHGDLLIVCNMICQLEHHRIVQIVLVVHLQII